jgi:microcystin-dependent protein
MDPYIGEIRLFAGNFAPKGWALCNGQLLPIAQNTALFSILGITYGGDGRTTFALPNFQDRVPVHQGQGNNLSPYVPGQTGGVAQVNLQISQLPAHVHHTGASGVEAVTNSPSAGVALALSSADAYGAATDLTPMATQTVGGNQPHSNVQPFLGLTFVIALNGIFPPRN